MTHYNPQWVNSSATPYNPYERYTNTNLEDLYQSFAGAAHGAAQCIVDTTLDIARYTGGVHGTEDMRFLDSFNLSDQANQQFRSSSSKWIQDVLRTDSNNANYNGFYSLTYMGTDLSMAFLPTSGAAKVGQVGKVATRTGKTARKIFQGKKAGTRILRTESGYQKYLLKEHLRQSEKYGKHGAKFLQNNKIRYYGELIPARATGQMSGRRRVREWDVQRSQYRTWHETLDTHGGVRIVRPQKTNKEKTHFLFDDQGKFIKKW